jgi:hypothetical protein
VKVCYFYTAVHPAAAEALGKFAPGAEMVWTGDGPYHYWQEIAARWTGEQDLVLIEHDNEIHAGVIESFAACPEPWCVYSYPIFRTSVDLTIGLGCTKISAAAQRMVTADELAEGFALCTVCEGQGCWWHLDSRIAEMLKYKCGLAQHVHGTVRHHHDYSDFDAGEAVAAHGRPIEWFFPFDRHDEPAVVLGEHWPLRELVAATPRQALIVAEQLAALEKDRAGRAVPARMSSAMLAYFAGDNAAIEGMFGPGWHPRDKFAATPSQAAAMAADLALLACEHHITL